MKRLLSVLVSLAMLFSLSGCKLIDKIFSKDEENFHIEINIDINGVNIGEYKIVCDMEGPDYNIRAAEYIKNSFKTYTLYDIPIVDDSAEQSAREIVVGETSRPVSKELDTDTEGFEFAMLAKDGTIALEADYFVIAAAAYYFVDAYIHTAPIYTAPYAPPQAVQIPTAKSITIPDGLTVNTAVTKEANNFILLIGDGMGVYQTMLYDYLEDTTDYSDGEKEFYGYMFPNLGFSRTNSYSGVTDSAAGGTALSTGYKTNNSYVGLDRYGNEIKSLTELAAELGKATAVMSTEKSTGATPASFSSHESSRNNTAQIQEDQTALTQKYGTIIECNYDYYASNYMKNSIEKRIYETLGKVNADNDGFFLMYEEAHIDKHSHNNDMEKTFKALIRFNQAIARFMEYAFYNPDTVVIITADHETGGLLPSSEDGNLYYNSEDHTSADVPVFAWGYGTEFFNEKTIENIEIAHFIASAMGVEDFGDKTGGWMEEIYGNQN